MAAHRKNVPLRNTTEVFAVGDGTMCRMPSPLPGPLRSEPDRELPELKSGWTKELRDHRLWESRSSTPASVATKPADESAPKEAVQRVA